MTYILPDTVIDEMDVRMFNVWRGLSALKLMEPDADIMQWLDFFGRLTDGRAKELECRWLVRRTLAKVADMRARIATTIMEPDALQGWQ